MEPRELVEVLAVACGGCGLCLGACPQEALQLAGGHVRLVNDALCEGCGLCVPECPQGALALTRRPAAPFDPVAVRRRQAQRARLRQLAEG